MTHVSERWRILASFSAAEREHWRYLFQEEFPGAPAAGKPIWQAVPKLGPVRLEAA